MRSHDKTHSRPQNCALRAHARARAHCVAPRGDVAPRGARVALCQARARQCGVARLFRARRRQGGLCRPRAQMPARRGVPGQCVLARVVVAFGFCRLHRNGASPPHTPVLRDGAFHGRGHAPQRDADCRRRCRGRQIGGGVSAVYVACGRHRGIRDGGALSLRARVRGKRQPHPAPRHRVQESAAGR